MPHPTDIASPSPAERRSLVLGLGFATATVMWAIGYAGFMRPGLVVGEVVFALELLVLAAGGWFAGRRLGSIAAGVGAGLVSAVVNLLIVGSIVR